jgi:hypothetical protein
VFGGGGGGQSDQLDELADAQFLAAQGPEHADAAFVRQGLRDVYECCHVLCSAIFRQLTK